MKPAVRWVIVVAVVVVIAILLWLWNQSGKQEAPTDTGAVQRPVEPTPPAPKPVEAVTAAILFDYNRSVLRPGETSKLDELTAKFKGGAFSRVDAIGHADRIGSDAYNATLSERRAESVRGYVVGKGVDSAKIRTEAKGRSESVTGDSCMKMGAENRKNRKLIECLQPDRRVQITLVPAR